MDHAAEGFLRIKQRHGSQALGGLGTAKGSNEEAYLLQKLIRCGFGTHSVDHCARLCHSSSVAALFDQIGSGGVTAAYTQCDNADLLLLVGCDPCCNHPVAASFFRRAARAGKRLIVIDPRYTEIADEADLVINHRPGSDVALLNAITQVIIEEGLLDETFIRTRTKGFEAYKASLQLFTPEAVSEATGVAARVIREVARLFGRAERAMIFWGMGITQHVHGVANARCLVNLALITGNVGRPGTGLHPLRGQNNVQGACDMGLLPTFLPGYALVENEKQRRPFEDAWGTRLPDGDGLTLIEMINAAHERRIRGLYFMGENPAMSDPDLQHVRQALCALDHLVVQELFLTETACYADVVLPGVSLLEKWGTFTNTNRQIQMARPVIASPGDARQDWWILQEIAKRLDLNWRYTHPQEIWEELRGLWPAVQGIPWVRLERDGWCQYPCARENEPGEDVLFAERFPTGDGLARLVPVTPIPPAEQPDAPYPMIFITGRILEHWHTGAMSRRSLVLNRLQPEAVIYLSAADMSRYALTPGLEVRLSSRRDTISAAARLDPGLPEGVVFMPFCFSEAAANLLTHAALDPQSKIPEYKYCAVRLDPAVAS